MRGTDDGVALIAASFGVGAAVAAPADGGAQELALGAAGIAVRPRCRAQVPINLPPGVLTGTAVGSYLDSPHQFGPREGWYWDVTSLTLSGFTAGSVAVTKNAPFCDSAGNPIAIESVASFTSAGIFTFPQHGMPLLDSSERLVFTVSSAVTGTVRVSGSVIMIPQENISSYLG